MDLHGQVLDVEIKPTDADHPPAPPRSSFSLRFGGPIAPPRSYFPLAAQIRASKRRPYQGATKGGARGHIQHPQRFLRLFLALQFFFKHMLQDPAANTFQTYVKWTCSKKNLPCKVTITAKFITVCFFNSWPGISDFNSRYCYRF